MLNVLRRLAGRVPADEARVSVAPAGEPSAASLGSAAPSATAVELVAGAGDVDEGIGELAGVDVAPEPPAAPPVPPIDCPYCGDAMAAPPRTRRCPSCRQSVIVRRLDGRTVYLTEAAAAVLEASRRQEADERAWTAARDRWLGLARSVRASGDLIAQIAAMPLTERAVEGAKAVYRTAADQTVREARQGAHWAQVSRLRSIEAAALYEDLGRPIPPPDDIVAVYREAKAAVLHSLAAHSPVAELAGSSCCRACRADDGELGTIAVELRKPRLPHAGCPRGLCECDWVVAMPEARKPRRRRAAGAAKTRAESADRTGAPG